MDSYPKLQWLAFILLGLAPLLVLGSSYFDSLFASAKPPGQTLFVLVRLSGLYAIYLLGIQIILALYKPNRLIFEHQWGRKAHVILGVVCACLILGHVLLFVGAAYIRTGTFSWSVFIPTFFEGYYKQRIGFGVLSMWLLTITLIAGIYRTKYPISSWRWLHKVAFLVFSLAVLHSVSIGSDTRSIPVIGFYCVLVAVVLAGLIRTLRLKK